MKLTSNVSTLPMVAALIVAGCSKSEGDTSPLPTQNPEARLDQTQKGIEASKMTPEQKAAAAAYLRQGAEGARQMRKTAERAGQPVGKS